MYFMVYFQLDAINEANRAQKYRHWNSTVARMMHFLLSLFG